MISLGFTSADVRRIVWTFVQGILAYALAAALDWVPGDAWDWKALVVGAIAAGLAAIKNGTLSDGSAIK